MENAGWEHRPEKRNCGSRVRGGCTNCKRSHIKCDQSKPSCGRCAVTKKDCMYPDTFRPVSTVDEDKNNIREPPSICPLNLDLTSYEIPYPGFGGPLQPQEQSYFYYFRQTVCFELSSVLPAAFWNCYVLPMSVHNSAVRYSIVALAAQHKAFAGSRQVPGNIHNTQDGYALMYYGKSMNSLKYRLSEASNVANMIPETLIMCLLFICLNILQDDDHGTMTHLTSGLQINSQLARSVKNIHRHHKNAYDPISELVDAFKRLDLQAALYLGSHQIKSVRSDFEDNRRFSDMNYSNQNFESIEDSRRSLTNVILQASHFMRAVAEPLKYVPHCSREVDATEWVDTYAQRDMHIRKLKTWLDLFERYLSTLSTTQKQLEKARYFVWNVSYAYTMIALSVCLYPDESEYDKHLSLFESILNNSKDIISATVATLPKGTAAKGCNWTFDMEVSIIQPLYFTALKCRKSEVRFRAIALLHQTRKEGIWDGPLMACIAEHVVRLEENMRHTSSDGRTTKIAEANRVCGVAINRVREKSKVSIECSMRNWSHICTQAEIPSILRSDPEPGQPVGYVWNFREDIIAY